MRRKSILAMLYLTFLWEISEYQNLLLYWLIIYTRKRILVARKFKYEIIVF